MKKKKKKKGGLILGPIPKISPKSNFFKKTGYRTGYNRNRLVTGTRVKPGSWFWFWFPVLAKNREIGPS